MSSQLFNDEIERNILSILLVEPDMMKECSLLPKHFLDKRCRRAYQIFQEFYAKNQTLDIFGMAEIVTNEAFFTDFCIDLMDQYSSKANFQWYIDLQEEHWRTQTLHDLAGQLQNGKLNGTEFIESIQKIQNDVLPANNGYLLPEEDIYHLVTQTDERLHMRVFNWVEKKIGIVKHTLNVIAARPGCGKTAFALNLMNDLSSEYKCIYFNMEMTEKELYQRLVSINSSIPINRFSQMDEHESEKMKQFIRPLSKKKIRIINGSKSIRSIRKILVKEQRDSHVVVFIDHVGYVKAERTGINDRERIGEVVRELQLMTKDLDITLFLLAHINRAGTDRPENENLKDSGELEQSAHVVMILHNTSDDPSDMTPRLDLVLGKNRSGRIGKIELEFMKATQIIKEAYR